MAFPTGVLASIRAYMTGDQARLIARPARVLVVDDEEPVVMLVDRILRDAGYETFTATSGPDAIKVVETSGPIDLLLSDFQMPRMVGSELARQLRRQMPTLKVLYLTGFS